VGALELEAAGQAAGQLEGDRELVVAGRQRALAQQRQLHLEDGGLFRDRYVLRVGVVAPAARLLAVVERVLLALGLEEGG
jgi:hypothetical protein